MCVHADVILLRTCMLPCIWFPMRSHRYWRCPLAFQPTRRLSTKHKNVLMMGKERPIWGFNWHPEHLPITWVRDENSIGLDRKLQIIASRIWLKSSILTEFDVSEHNLSAPDHPAKIGMPYKCVLMRSDSLQESNVVELNLSIIYDSKNILEWTDPFI